MEILMKLSSQVWAELSYNDQSNVIIDLYQVCLKTGYCSNKGRKPVEDLQLVIQHVFGIKLDTAAFALRCKGLLNKGDSNSQNKALRQQQMLKTLAELFAAAKPVTA